MKNRFIIRTTNDFDRSYQKLIKANRLLKNKIILAIKILSESPYDVRLKTHKVNTRKLGEVNSSRVTGDLRILWIKVEPEKYVILCLTIGIHDKVY
jgi:mRNA-degrading endonuclease YafQ of YafQ-DinJ toxin-antitoxin module